jgi:glycosyltransferase involved in cell wall biosynthesis
MACGTAVVASDLPVHREVTGGHARLVPVGDVDALAAAILAATDDAADGSGLPTAGARDHRSAARVNWAAGWTWTRCAAQTLAAYRRAVG